jgi:hypothetical protein
MPPIIPYKIQYTFELALFEPSQLHDLIIAWCFLVVIACVEFTLPVLFGFETLQTGIWFVNCAIGLFWMDKLAILLLLYCLLTTANDFILPRLIK